MSLPIYPKVRGLTWPVMKSAIESTITQTGPGGTTTNNPQWQNPKWEFTLIYEYLKDNPYDVLPQYSPYTDYATLQGFFLANYGSAAQFLFDLRVKRAKTLLAEFSIPLSEVRKVAGFGSLSQLTRRFHRAAGMSPQQYRTAAQQQRLQRRGEAPSGNRAAPPAKQRTTEENFPQLCGGTRAAESPPTRCLPRWPRQGG